MYKQFIFVTELQADIDDYIKRRKFTEFLYYSDKELKEYKRKKLKEMIENTIKYFMDND